MRTTLDRIRHTILFEVFAIVTATPIVIWITGQPIEKAGGLAILMSLIAMAWNFSFNMLFDRYLERIGHKGNKTVKQRLVHGLAFEGGLVIIALPLIAYWLDMSLLAAFIMDIGSMLFFMVYAIAYNWLYDHVFPITDESTTESISINQA